MFVLKEQEYGFQASLRGKRPRFDLLDDVLKVPEGINTTFAEYEMTFQLALPSWLCKLSKYQIRTLAENLIFKKKKGLFRRKCYGNVTTW